MATTVDVYTDGSCLGNPGPGGWGSVILFNGSKSIVSGSEPETTNNRMELEAVVQGLAALPALDHSAVITVHSDSRYVIDGITKWIKGWKKSNWKTASRQPVKNSDLWKRLDALVQEREYRGKPLVWKWVKGHSGDPMNELVDKIARDAAGAAGAEEVPSAHSEDGVHQDVVEIWGCDSCGHLYMVQVTTCDCMPDTQSFTPFVAVKKVIWDKVMYNSKRAGSPV